MKSFKKLCIGLFLFYFFYYVNDHIGGADGLSRIEKYLKQVLFFIPSKLADIIASVIVIAIGAILFYCFISGLFRICSFNLHVPEFEDKAKGGIVIRGHSAYPNINRVLSYRESKLAGLSYDEATELLMNTSKLDALYSGYNSGAETQRVLSYTESKLSSMSSDRALNFLANKL